MNKLFALLLVAFQTLAFAQTGVGLEWAIATSTQPNTDRKIVFRYIKQFQSSFDKLAYPHRIIIAWRYNSSSGMPSKAEAERMDHFEDLLDPAMEKVGLAALVLVSTGEGLREWIYYAKSEEQFFQVLNSALANEAKLPIEIHAAQDAAWTTFAKFQSGLRK